METKLSGQAGGADMAADGKENNQAIDEKMGFTEAVSNILKLKDMDPLQYSSLNLAYIGDDVYDLIIRTYLLSLGNEPVNYVNRHANMLVKAGTQSKMVEVITPLLTQEELSVYKRGRNAKSATSAKNATIVEYRRATGFEALVGYLYILGRYERMVELIRKGLEGIGEMV